MSVMQAIEQEVQRIARLAKLAHDNAPRSASNPDAPWLSVVRTVLYNHGNPSEEAHVVIGKALVPPDRLTTPHPSPPHGAADEECAHCEGEGIVDDGDTYMPGLGMIAQPRACLVCDGTGEALVDAYGVCAEPCCSQFEWDARAGSDRAEPCGSRTVPAVGGAVTCILAGPHSAHLSAPPASSADPEQCTWLYRDAIPEGEG